MKKDLVKIIGGFAILMLASCATTGSVEPINENLAVVETQKFLANYTDYIEVVYSGDMDRTLNISVPNNPDEAVQCILYLCDDVLTAEDNRYIQFLETMKNTHLVASMNYQFNDPEKIRVKDIIVDIDDVISHIKTMAAEHSVAINRVILVGHVPTSNHMSMYIF
jgi:hypothetical protein